MSRHTHRRLSCPRSRRLVGGAALTTLAIGAVAAPALAESRGPATFAIAPIGANQETAPSVLAMPSGSAVAAWVSYTSSAAGDVMVCTIVRRAAGCNGAAQSLGPATTATDPQTTSGNQAVLVAGPGNEVVVLAGVNSTYAFVSMTGGQSFSGPVAVSNSLVAQAGEWVAGEQDILIAGDSNGATAGQVSFAEVSLTGTDLNVTPVVEPATAASNFTIGLYQGTPVVAAASQGSVVWFKQAAGAMPNLAASWTGGAIADSTAPALATTTRGLVLGAASLGRPTNVPEAFEFTGAGFRQPTVLQSIPGVGPSVVQFAAAGSLVGGVPRYTLSWYDVGSTGPKTVDYASSSTDGTHWVTKQIATSSGDLHSEAASISPDGGGLVVQDDTTAWRAVRLYVGTTLTTKPKKLVEHKGHKATVKVTLRTDLGAAVKGVTVRLQNKAGHLVKKLKTSAKGIAKGKVHATKSTSFSFVYAGTTLYDPSQATIKYTVKKKRRK